MEQESLQKQMEDEIARWAKFYGIEFSAKERKDLAIMLNSLVTARDKQIGYDK